MKSIHTVVRFVKSWRDNGTDDSANENPREENQQRTPVFEDACDIQYASASMDHKGSECFSPNAASGIVPDSCGRLAYLGTCRTD